MSRRLQDQVTFIVQYVRYFVRTDADFIQSSYSLDSPTQYQVDRSAEHQANDVTANNYRFSIWNMDYIQ